MVKEAAIKTVYIFIILFTAFGLFAENTRPPARQINSNPVNVVAVGYDIENNTKAQQMLNDMAQAAQESGAAGKVILAGRDEAELDNAMEQAISIATGAGACRLEIKTPSVSPGERIIVVHSDFPIEDKTAWIGFYENENDSDEDYISYAFLVNLKDRIYDVTAPAKSGKEYHFRLFKTRDYKCAAQSAKVEVK